MGGTLRRIISVAAPIAGGLLAGPAGAAAGGALGGALNGGGVKGALIGGATAGIGAEAFPAVGNAFASEFPETAASLGITGGANSLTDILGQTTGGSSWGGPGTIGGLFDSGSGSASGANSLGKLLSSGSLSSDNTPLTGGSLSGAAPSNSLASPTLTGTGGGASSYGSGSAYGSSDWNIPGVAKNLDLTAADPALASAGSGTGGLPWQQPGYVNPPAGAVSAAATGGKGMGSNLSMLGTLLGAGSSLMANNSAQSDLLKSQKNALNELSPYLQSGGAANTKLSDLLGTNPNGTTASTADILAASPQYQFQLDQGNQELDRQNAARGGYFSGGAIKAGQQFANGLASQTAQQYYQNLAQQAGVGASTAGAAGNIYQNTGATQANATLANNGVFNNTLGSLLASNGARHAVNIGGQIVYI